MKIFNLIFTILFLLFAALQYNDPDPYVWIPIYVYGAILCWMAFNDRYYVKAYWIGIVIYLAYAVFLVFTKNGVIDWITVHNSENLVQTMKAEKPWIEDTREFGGLVILIIVLLIDLIYAKRKARYND